METDKQVAWIGSLLAVGLLVSAPSARGAETSDSIRVKGKTMRYSGRITKETPTAVTLERRGKSKTFKITEITTITYGNMSREMRQAFLDLKAGGDKLPKALKGFAETAPAADAAKQKFLRQALEFGQAEATARIAYANPAGKDDKGALWVDKAIELLEDFQRNSPQSRHHFPLHLWLGRMYTAKGKAAEAEKAFQILGQSEFTSYKLQAEVQRAKIYVGAKEYDKALKILDAVIKQQTTDPAERQNVHEAMVLRCRCLQAKGNTEDAIKYLNQVIKDAAPEDQQLRAMAHNTLGECQRTLGQNKDALLNHLWVDVIYFTVGKEHPRALYGIAQCWDDLSEPAKAAKVRQRLKVKYPRSDYTKNLAPSR